MVYARPRQGRNQSCKYAESVNITERVKLADTLAGNNTTDPHATAVVPAVVPTIPVVTPKKSKTQLVNEILALEPGTNQISVYNKTNNELIDLLQELQATYNGTATGGPSYDVSNSRNKIAKL